MVDPATTLGLLTQVSVSILGFSGVVVVFGRRTSGEWTEIERARLGNLLSTSFAVLFNSLGALVLLNADLDESTVWRIFSPFWAVGSGFMSFAGGRRILRIPLDEPSRPSDAITFTIIGVSLLLAVVNLTNVFFGAFWPFMLGQVWLFAVACYSFRRLLIFA